MIPLSWTGGLETMRSPASPVDTDPRTPPSRWVAVGVIMLATFIVVTSEMLPVGVLTPMADGLGISAGAAGSSLTITGLVSAATAPIVPRVLGNLDRRMVLAAAMVVLAVGNALTAIAAGFGLLVVSRIILGVGMGVVWGMASAVATRLVAPEQRGLAVSIAVGGVAAASVLGVPLGTIVGNAFGWRAAFASLAALAVATALALIVTLPILRRPATDAVTSGPIAHRSLARPAVVTGLVVVVLLVTAHFAAYTYVRPVLEDRTGLSAAAIALVLLLYGVFGLIGNFAAGAAATRDPRGTVIALAAGVAAAISILAGLGTITQAAGLAVALWGLAYGGLSVGAQLWMTSAAPDRIEHITGLYVGLFTGAIALGAAVGGLLVEGAGTVPMLWVAAGLASIAALIAVLGPGEKGNHVAGAAERR